MVSSPTRLLWRSCLCPLGCRHRTVQRDDERPLGGKVDVGIAITE